MLALWGDDKDDICKLPQDRATLLSLRRGVQPAHCTQPRMAMNVAQHKIVNLLNIFCCFCSCLCINVWPKTALLLPLWSREAKRLDAPAREYHQGSLVGILLFGQASLRPGFAHPWDGACSWKVTTPDHSSPVNSQRGDDSAAAFTSCRSIREAGK